MNPQFLIPLTLIVLCIKVIATYVLPALRTWKTFQSAERYFVNWRTRRSLQRHLGMSNARLKRQRQERRAAEARERKAATLAAAEAIIQRQEAQQRQERLRQNPRTPDAFAELDLMRARAEEIPDHYGHFPFCLVRSLQELPPDHQARQAQAGHAE